MNYANGALIRLGDVVAVPVPSGEAKARVVMLGDTYDHLDIDPAFLRWVESSKILDSASVVLEWLGSNPFAHKDPKYAPAGNYMFSPADHHLVKVAP